MNLRTLRLTAVSMLAALTFIAACTEKDAYVEAQDPAIARQIVDQYARVTLAATGQDKFSQGGIASMPCEGRQGELSDRIYTMYGVYQLLVPADEQLAMLDRVRDAWKAQGYTITSQRTYPPGARGEVNATNPKDGALFSLSSGQPPSMSLSINTKCHRRPA